MSAPREDAAQPAPPASLVALQTAMVAWLVREEPVTADPAQAEATRAHVAGNARLTPAEQVDIYRRQFWLRHEAALVEDYPGLRHVVGAEVFEAFVRAYLAAHPPVAFSLRDLGHAVATFAETYPFAPDRAELARDMARYERSFVDVFDGADPPPLDPAAIAAVPADAWERARILLNPLVVRHTLAYPVHRLRLDVRAGAVPSDPEAGPAPREALPAREPCRVALFRERLVVSFEELCADRAALLDALAAGDSLVAACARVTAGRPEDEVARLGASVGTWFRRWTERGFIAGIELGAATS